MAEPQNRHFFPLFLKRSIPYVKSKISIIILILIFFGPYLSSTQFRMDTLIGVVYIILMYFFFIRGYHFFSTVEKSLFVVSLFIPIYSSITLLPYALFPLQFINYQLYFAVAMSVWIFHRKALIENRNIFLSILIFISIPISLLGILQRIDNSHFLVDYFLTYYGPPPSEAYSLENLGIATFKDYGSIGAITLFADASVISIFNGKHTLAVWSLFMMAIHIGSISDKYFSINRLILYTSLLLNIIVGFLSTSKIFIFGIIIFISLLFILSRFRQKIYLLILLLFSLFTMFFAAIDNRILSDILNVLSSGSLFSIFESRFGADGYITSNNHIFNDPFVWLFGFGQGMSSTNLSDSQYRSLIGIGGVPYLFLFISFVFILLTLNWRYRHLSPYGLSFFCLGIALIIGGSGIEVYWQGRVIPLWVLSQLLLILNYPPNNMYQNN